MLAEKDINSAFTDKRAKRTINSSIIATASQSRILYGLDTVPVYIRHHEASGIADLKV